MLSGDAAEGHHVQLPLPLRLGHRDVSRCEGTSPGRHRATPGCVRDHEESLYSDTVAQGSGTNFLPDVRSTDPPPRLPKEILKMLKAPGLWLNSAETVGLKMMRVESLWGRAKIGGA